MAARTMVRSLLLVGFLAMLSTVAWSADWPQWRGPDRDGQWTETGLVEEFNSSELSPKWKVDISSGYSGPTVADGRVFITDRLVQPQQTERVHCFDEQTGKPIWSHEYPCKYVGVGYEAGPRANVTVEGDSAYALGAMGDLFCFDAASGEVRWQRDLNADYGIRMPIWGIAAAPLVYKDLVIVHIGGRGASVVALNKQTGKEVWKALDDRAQYAAPILIRQGNQDVLVVWTGDNVVGLDPQSGRSHWSVAFKPTRMPIGISTPVIEGDRLFCTSFYDGSLMLQVDPDKPQVKELWRRRGPNERNTDALHSIIATPLFIDDYVYGVDSYGELRCLEAATGDRVWESQKATPRARWSNIHMVENGDRVWMFNERGDLIISRLSPQGYEEISRAHLIDPTTDQLRQRGGVCWAHPAFANKCVFIRNDKELLCVSLAKE